MSKKKAQTFNNDWQSLASKPEKFNNNKINNNVIEEPYKLKREGAYLSMFPSDQGKKYSFCIIPDKDGKSFLMTEVMTIKRFKFKNPKTGEDYFENLKLPMDPNMIFDMDVVKKAISSPDKLTDEEKKTLKNIKRHEDLVKRWKNLYYCREEGINFGYSPSPTRYNGRLRKDALTGFFGVPTKWDGTEAAKHEVKFIQNRYVAFQDKFRSLLEQTSETHDELQPTWYEDYFSNSGGYKGVIDVEMGSMKVGGKGATVKLIKIGKDNIEDKGAGVLGGLDDKKVSYPKGDENALSHLHYYMGFNSTESLWQDIYVDRLEEAIVDLEGHVEEVKLENLNKENTTQEAQIEGSTPEGNQGDDLPF